MAKKVITIKSVNDKLTYNSTAFQRQIDNIHTVMIKSRFQVDSSIADVQKIVDVDRKEVIGQMGLTNGNMSLAIDRISKLEKELELDYKKMLDLRNRVNDWNNKPWYKRIFSKI